jgi:hypothetical protein
MRDNIATTEPDSVVGAPVIPSIPSIPPIPADSLNFLLRFGESAPAGGSASPRGPYQEPVVRVSVLGVPLDLPEPVLSDALSHLRLATEANVGLWDYAKAVALVLEALAKRGMITFLV